MTPVADWLRQERLGLVARLSGLSASEWETPSLCAGWTVRDVLAHLVTPFAVRPTQMALRVVRAKGISAAMDVVARDLARRPTDSLLELLTRNAASTFHPPGMPLAAPLTDAVVHGADIRWALGYGTNDWADVERLRPVLNFLVSRRALVGFMPRNRIKGLRLVAGDQEWHHGSGEDVSGSSLALALGLLGRKQALPLLAGPGVAALANDPQ
jgi:uncharacterized protein (TIGR03083 family)